MLSPIYSAACWSQCGSGKQNSDGWKSRCIARILGLINKCNLCLCRCRMELRSAGWLSVGGLMLLLCSSLGKFWQKQHWLSLLHLRAMQKIPTFWYEARNQCVELRLRDVEASSSQTFKWAVPLHFYMPTHNKFKFIKGDVTCWGHVQAYSVGKRWNSSKTIRAS